MSTITTRSGKGSALTHTEMDNNFNNLNTDKKEDVSNTWSTEQNFAGQIRVKETVDAVYSVTATVGIDPANGAFQRKILDADVTLTFTAFEEGQGIMLALDDGTAHTAVISATWVTDAGAAPTLATTGWNRAFVWYENAVLYAARVGDWG